MKWRASAVGVTALALALLTSCGSDSLTGTADGDDYSRETPEDVLQAIAFALENRDIDVYSECLADDFEFGFVEHDCEGAGVPAADPWWGKSEDMASTDSMLSHALVSDIEVDLPVNSSSSSGSERAFRCEPSIKVVYEDAGGGEPEVFFVNSSWLHVKLVKDEVDTTLWQISEMREELKENWLKGGCTATEKYTFGEIKGEFRRLRACEKAPRSTPECLIEAFEWSLMNRKYYEYPPCLSDMFLFEFTPEDAELVGLPADEPWWGKTQDVQTVTNIIRDNDVATIFCELAIESGPSQSEGGFTYRLEPDIRIAVEPGGGHEPVTYIVDASWLDVEIVPDPYNPEQWVFHRMTEVLKETRAAHAPDLGPATQPSTFGSIKAMYK